MYTVLFRHDCGDFLGLGGHRGDVEPFSLTLAPNASCPNGYGVFSLKTIAHEGTFAEHVDERLLGNSCTWGRVAGGSPTVSRVYASENKHGLYASDESCDAGLFGFDNCSESFTRNYTVYNVGEDNHRLIDELSASQFPGEYAWSQVKFRGGTGESCCGDAGYVRNKWVSDQLLAIATNPPPSTLCNQPAHAWYENPGRAAFVYQGQQILLTAAGVTPNTVVSFHFSRHDGTQVAYYQTRWANNNCVVNQEYMTINAGTFPAGTYEVHALYSEPISIGGSLTRTACLMDLDVRTPPPPPPDPCTVNPDYCEPDPVCTIRFCSLGATSGATQGGAAQGVQEGMRPTVHVVREHLAA